MWTKCFKLESTRASNIMESWKGSVNIWHDNWTRLGDLYTVDGEKYEAGMRHAEHAHNELWNKQLLQRYFAREVIEQIMKNVKSLNEERGIDKPCYMLESRKNFPVKSAWQYMKHKENTNRILNGYG